MRHTRLLIIPFVMLFILACGLSNGIRQIEQAATNLPDLLTSAPTTDRFDVNFRIQLNRRQPGNTLISRQLGKWPGGTGLAVCVCAVFPEERCNERSTHFL